MFLLNEGVKEREKDRVVFGRFLQQVEAILHDLFSETIYQCALFFKKKKISLSFKALLYVNFQFPFILEGTFWTRHKYEVRERMLG